MPKGLTKFQDSWLQKEWDGVLIGKWLEAVNDNIHSAKCTLCSETFLISGSGIDQVRSHHKGKKHFLKFNTRFKNKSLFETIEEKNNNTDAGALSFQNQILKAETLWALHVANENFLFKSCNTTLELIKEMFPDSSIASSMQLKEKKVAYVLKHGIAKYFEKSLVKDIADSSPGITLAFDETTNIQTKRQLDIYARYWSKEFNLVTCRYLRSVFLGHATADIILKELLDAMSAFGIPLDKIICLSMDNPNVNKSVLKKFSDKIGNDTLLPIGACNLHVANNAFKTFLNALDINFDEFANDVHFFLKHSAVRREDFKCVEEITHETAQFLLKHVNSRWLSAGPVAQRLVEQWANMSEYFLNFLPKQKLLEKQLTASSKYRRICDSLKLPSTQCSLAFISYTHEHFERFSLCFQSKEPKIHLLFSEMNKLIRNIMMQFLKDEIVSAKEGAELRDIDIENGNNWKKLISMEIGMSAKDLLHKLNQKDKKSFLLNVRSALIKTVSYLKSHMPFSDQFFKDLEIFHPRIPDPDSSKCNSVHAVTRIARYLNFSDHVIDNIREEWKLFIFDIAAHEKLKLSETMRIDAYWRELFLQKDICNQLKYVNLTALIKTVFILPHGNSDPERGFSINKAMVNVNHNEETIVSLRFVKDTIKNYGGVLNVPITLSLLTTVRDSHKSYLEYTGRIKEEEEKLEKEKKQIKKEEHEKEETRKRKNDLDLQITENNNMMSKLKKNKEVALGLIREGSERLSKAAVTQNNVEMTVARNLISEGSEQLQKLEAELSVFEAEKEQILKKRLKIN